MDEDELLKAVGWFLSSLGKSVADGLGRELKVRAIPKIKDVVQARAVPNFPFQNAPSVTKGTTFFTPSSFEQHPFDDMRRYIEQQIMKKAGQLTYLLAMKTVERTPEIVRSYIEYRREQLSEQLVNSNCSVVTSAALTSEFIFGYGPEMRYFNEDHPFTQSLMDSNMTTIALEKFYKGYEDYVAGERSDPPSSYRVDFSPFPFTGDTGPFREFIKDGFSAAQFLGTATYTFKLEGDTLTVEVYDTKTEYSFMYHFPGTDRHQRSEDPIMGETTQYYEFSLSLDEIRERLGKNEE
ncbi:MAG TPA: hypothetical protein DEQ30_01980 [Porphyromonadaceae bacterium]|nr:hypothetical protein [Porphyromonadaceae bacterium]